MLVQDFRAAYRTLVTRPGFAATAIGTLALGIGANAAIFSVVQAVLLRPLRYSDADRLVKIVGFDRRDNEPDNLSPADFLDFDRDSRSFERMGAHGWVGSFTVTGGPGGAERVGGVNVTEGFFPTLRIEPALGRAFRPEEDRPGGTRVALLSHAFWVRRYGADPTIVGRIIAVNARPTLVVGVLPADFRHVEANPDRSADLYLPYQFDSVESNRGAHFIRAVGRLRPGVALDHARAELDATARALELQYPVSNTAQGVLVQPLHEAMVAGVRPALALLTVAVTLLLLVACSNLANLLLARGSARQRELAVRSALGAGRRRLVAQLLTESAVLGVAGGGAGLLVALAATPALHALAAAGVPRADEIRVDAGVLAFSVSIAVACSLLFGLVPALQLTRSGHLDVLKEGGRTPGSTVRRGAREALIVAEVAVSLVLLVGAGLLVRSLWALQAVDPGFAAGQITAMDVSLPVARYEEGTQIPFYARLEHRLRQIPGVRHVGAVNILPLSANYDSRGVQIDDRPVPAAEAPSIQARSVTVGYFGAMGIPLLRGRLFDEHDDLDRPMVVVISESMARRYWPGEDAVGHRLTFNSGIPPAAQRDVGGPGSRTIVGVVGDVKHLGLAEAEVPMFYTPHGQQPSYHTMTFVLRGDASPVSLAPVVRRVLSEMDPEVPLYQVRTLDQVVSASVADVRLRVTLLSLFAVLAGLLASVGVYGVVAFIVSQRTHEVGVRMALGAGPGEVLRLVVSQGLRPVMAGIVLGLVGAFASSRHIASMLFGIAVDDVTTYVMASLVLTAAALAATLVPARRAVRVDPAVALRAE
jgi:putative ABC transport system permease protein